MGKWFKNSKKLIALFMTLMMMFALSLSILADSAPGAIMVSGGSSSSGGQTTTTTTKSSGQLFALYPIEDPTIEAYFRVHASGSYADIGTSKVCFNTEDNTGYIKLISKITFTINGEKVTLPKDTKWFFKVSSYKDGAKITLTFDSPSYAKSLVKRYNMDKMTGKIHIDSKRFNKMFWKIDCLGCGFYFRCD